MTIFQKIIDREIPADIVFENDEILAFRDINPQAPVHVVCIPKKPVSGIAEAEVSDQGLLGSLMLVAAGIARSEGLENGYLPT